jgi:hypothetical protein
LLAARKEKYYYHNEKNYILYESGLAHLFMVGGAFKFVGDNVTEKLLQCAEWTKIAAINIAKEQNYKRNAGNEQKYAGEGRRKNLAGKQGGNLVAGILSVEKEAANDDVKGEDC